MRRLANVFAWLGAIAIFGVMTAGCGDPQPPIDRVGVNVVEKSAFDGSWYMHRTVIDMEYEAAPLDFVGDNAGDATGGFLGFSIPRIRWVIDESFLYAYRDYEIVADPDDPFSVAGEEDEDFLGQPVAAFAIESHFDIQRLYNSVTGEQQNVIVEDTADRHWYERQFMRVDWSVNLIAGHFGNSFEVRNGVTREPAALYFQDGSDFPEEWRPQFHFMSCRDDGTGCSRADEDYAQDYDQDTLYSMSFVTQELVSPAGDPFFGVVCRFSDEFERFFPSAPECATVGVRVRTSFLRVSDRREYEPVAWTNDRFERAGYFALDRPTYDRTHDAGDPSYGVTDFTNQSANRHNIWRDWYDVDAEGNRTPVPYADREIRPIIWYLSSETPAHLVKPSYELVSEWNEVLMATVRQLRGQEVPRYAPETCQTEDPGGYCYCQNDPRTGVTLNPTCAGRYDPFETPDQAAARIVSGTAYDCHVQAVGGGDARALEPDWNDAGLGDADFNPWFGTEMVGADCVNVLRMNGCHLGNVDGVEGDDAIDGWGDLDCQERGDVRYKLLSFVDQPGTPFLGVAQLRGDPITGEVITGDANIGGPAMHTQRTRALEAYDLINGNITEAQYFSGEDVRAFINAVSTIDLPAPPRTDITSALRGGHEIDPLAHREFTGVMNRAAARAELLSGPEGRAAIFQDRGQLLAGTPIEQQLVNGADAFALGGFDALPESMSAESPTDDAMARMSPFRIGFMERMEEMRDLQLRRELNNMLMPNEYTDDSVLSFVNQHRDWTRVHVEFELDRRLYRDTQVHEMGHCLGLRHHFGGTADPGNYFDGYYTINEEYPLPDPADFNTDGTPGLSPTEQIAFEEEYGRLVSVRELAGIDQWMNSSVMDYTPNWYQRINGAGYHDFMAISFGYGDIVDIYDNSVAADGTARPALPADSLTPVNTRRVGVKFYHGGETCNTDAECPFSATGSRSNELLPSNIASGLTQRCVPDARSPVNVCTNFDNDAAEMLAGAGPSPAWVPVSYFYCEDIRASTRSLPGCATFDEGDTFREIARNQLETYERDYIFSAFRRYRRRFSIGNYVGRLIRFMDPLLGIYQNLIYRYTSDPEFRNQEGAFGFEDEFLATADIMNIFARMLASPSVGSYDYNNGWDRFELTSFDVEPDAQVSVPFGQGRYLNSIYQTGLTGISRVERIGAIYDSIIAMQLLTIRGLGPFYGADVVFQTNFYDIFPNEIEQIFTGMIAGRPEDFMPRLQCNDEGWIPGRRCDDSRIVYMDFYRGDCSIDPSTGAPDPSVCRENPAEVTYRDLEVLNGGTRFFLQSYAAIYALQSFPVYYDTTFQNQMFLCVEGQATCPSPADAPDAIEGVDYVRHTSSRFGKSFLAWQVDSLEGQSQASIAFAMVKEARDLTIVLRLLRKARGDGLPGDPEPSFDHLTPEDRAQLAAVNYELPTDIGQLGFEIRRIDSRRNSLESFFFFAIQLERAFGIEFPFLYNRPEI